MAIDRLSKLNARQRRTFQQLAAGFGFEFSGGIQFDRDNGAVTLDLRDVDPGLVVAASGLGILLGSTPGLTNTGGLSIILDTTSCLALAAGGLSLDLRNTDPGLERTANGVGILLAGTSGLTTTGGLGIVAIEGRFTVTAVKTGTYTAAIGELVRCDPSGAGFTVNLPASSTGNSGRQIIVKNVTGSANAITIDGNGAETIDGAATVAIAAGFGSVHLIDNGGGDWMTV